MPLTLRKASYTSRTGSPGNYKYVYGSGEHGPHHLALTQSGKQIQHSKSPAYDSVHRTPYKDTGHAVRKEFPGYSAQDHADAAVAHRKDRDPSRRFSHLIGDAHHDAAVAMGHKASPTKEASKSEVFSPRAKTRMAYLFNRKSMTKENDVDADLKKAKYVSRKQVNGKWQYSYASGSPKTREGAVHHAAEHAAAAEGHRMAAEQHAKAGHKSAAEASNTLANHHDQQAKHYTKMASGMRHQENSERMMTPSEKEHASRAPSTRNSTSASHPWEKSEMKKMGMKKANELDGITFGQGAIRDANGQIIDTDPQSLTELQQMIGDFEAAGIGSTQGARIVALANASGDTQTGVPDASVIPASSLPVEVDGNAPTFPIGQAIEIQKSQNDAPARPMGDWATCSAIAFFTGAQQAQSAARSRDN